MEKRAFTMDEHETRALSDDETGTHLGLWDAVSIIVGIVVGTTIFKAPQLVFGNVENAWWGMFAWALGGMVALVGSFCYAELATTYPRMGGDYVYLTRAFGRRVGFLFGWAQLTAIRTGSIGAMAYVFGDYAVQLFELDASQVVWWAVGSILVLTVMNLMGVVCGKTTQNILSLIKVIGLCSVVVVGFGWGTGGAVVTPASEGGAVVAEDSAAEQAGESIGATAAAPQVRSLGEIMSRFGMAMVFVFLAYGGWNDAAFVAAEVRNRQRNLPWALFIGTGGIMVIYLLVNAAYLYGLGFAGVSSSPTPAADVLRLASENWGARIMSLLVMLSALGAINGLIFTGARIYVGLGSDHQLFALLGRWHVRRNTPIWSLLAQSAVSLVLVLLVGTEAGRNLVDAVLTTVFLPALPWADYFGGFDTLVAGTAPVFWLFFLGTGLSMFVLRVRDRGIHRPFAAPLFPLEPIIFCLMCLYMLYSALVYAKGLALLGLVPLAVGLPLYSLSCRMGAPAKRAAGTTKP
jgi:basic amino acid/polyamine antiporter, APA family